MVIIDAIIRIYFSGSLQSFKLNIPTLYLVFWVLFLMGGYFLYRLATEVAIDLSSYYRTSVDLYRMELLKKLHYKLPANLFEERSISQNISTFFVVGDRLVWDENALGSKPYYYNEASNQNFKDTSNAVKTNISDDNKFGMHLLFSVMLLIILKIQKVCLRFRD